MNRYKVAITYVVYAEDIPHAAIAIADRKGAIWDTKIIAIDHEETGEFHHCVESMEYILDEYIGEPCKWCEADREQKKLT